MSEPVAKQRQMIDLDEFERRLTRPAPAARKDDPLAELARLVGGGEDRFESMFQARPVRAAQPVAEPQAADWRREELHQSAEPDYDQTVPRREIDFAAIEAGLRGSLPPEFQNFADNEQQDEDGEDDHWLNAPAASPPAHFDELPPRSRIPLYATAAIILAGMAGIGGTFALKRTPASPQQIALITAPTTPVKVAAPRENDTTASSNASILDKTLQPAPTGLASHSEQPVDVNAVGKPAPAPQVGSTAPATSVPVPAPPGAEATQGVSLADMIEPRKVKTIAIRPDSNSGELGAPATSDPAPVSTIMPPSMAGDYGSAGLTEPHAPATAPAASAPAASVPASPARAASAKTASTGDDLPWSAEASAAAPVAAAPIKSHGHKPVKVASAETGDTDVAEAPAHAAGGFSVQLAAPATQAEAHSALLRLTHSYGGELRGYHLKFHQAKVANKTVFRVRVGGLTHQAAISLCEKLKAKGGACFVARE